MVETKIEDAVVPRKPGEVRWDPESRIKAMIETVVPSILRNFADNPEMQLEMLQKYEAKANLLSGSCNFSECDFTPDDVKMCFTEAKNSVIVASAEAEVVVMPVGGFLERCLRIKTRGM